MAARRSGPATAGKTRGFPAPSRDGCGFGSGAVPDFLYLHDAPTPEGGERDLPTTGSVIPARSGKFQPGGHGSKLSIRSIFVPSGGASCSHEAGRRTGAGTAPDVAPPASAGLDSSFRWNDEGEPIRRSDQRRSRVIRRARWWCERRRRITRCALIRPTRSDRPDHRRSPRPLAGEGQGERAIRRAPTRRPRFNPAPAGPARTPRSPGST